MRKLKILLPYVAALLIIALCVGGMQAARWLLPDYKEQTQEIDLSNRSPVFSLTSDSAPLFPWNLYDSVSFYDAEKSPVYGTAQELIAFLIATYSPEIEEDYQFEFQPSIEYAISGDNPYDITYIRDLTLRDRSGTRYTINIAFADGQLVYYSCVKQAEAPGYQQVKAGYEALKNEYADYHYLVQPLMQEVDGEWSESEIMADDYFDAAIGSNVFHRFIARTEAIDVMTQGTDLLPLHEDFTVLIANGQTSGVQYDGTQMTMRFFYNNRVLTLFYDPEQYEITGFSYTPAT